MAWPGESSSRAAAAWDAEELEGARRAKRGRRGRVGEADDGLGGSAAGGGADEFGLGDLYGWAWRVTRANLCTLLAVQASWAALALLLGLAVIVLLSAVEVLGGPDEVAPGPRSLASALDLSAELDEDQGYVVGLDYLTDLAFSLLLVYPALASFFSGVFAAMRRADALGGATVLQFSEFFSRFPTSARRSFPLAAGLLLFAGRMCFTLLDFLVVDVWLPSVSPTLRIVGKALVWIPYLVYTVVSCFVLAFHVERPGRSAWWALQESAGIVSLYIAPVFWFVMLSICLLALGGMLMLVGLLVVVPCLLLAVAYLFESVVGVRSPGHEEPHEYMQNPVARGDDGL